MKMDNIPLIPAIATGQRRMSNTMVFSTWNVPGWISNIMLDPSLQSEMLT